MGELNLTWIVFRHELRSALRDRNTVIYSIVIPFVLYPALIWGVTQWMEYREGTLEKQVSRVALEGGDRLPEFTELLRADPGIDLAERPCPPGGLEEETVDACLVLSDPVGSGPPLLEGRFDLSRDRSEHARERIASHVEEYRRSVAADRLEGYGETDDSFDIIRVEEKNIATAEEMGRFFLSLILPLLLVIMLSIGAMHPAVDVLAGEKERKTIESILASGAPRLSILAGKFLVVTAASLAALFLNLAGMILALAHLVKMMGERMEMNIAVPWNAIPVIFIAGLLLAMFLSATMIFLSSFARSFKEGQSYVTPFYLFTLLPALAASVPGMKLDAGTALIPIVNVVLLLREAMNGVFHPPLIGLVVFSLALCAAAALFVAGAVYGDEGVLLGAGRSLRSLPEIMRQRKG